MDGHHLRSTLPELRMFEVPAAAADFFLDQLRTAGLLQPTIDATAAADKSFSSNTELWDSVLRERVRTRRIVSLNGFYVSEWIPRAPGVFHTPNGEIYREMAWGEVIEEPHDHELEWIDHASTRQFERGIYETSDTQRYTKIFAHSGKLQMIQGGIGCVRLRQHIVAGTPTWFMSASSSLAADEGFLLAVPDELYQRMIDSIVADGVLYCDSIVGTVRYVPDYLGDLYQAADVPPVYLDVLEFRRGNRPDNEGLPHPMISVAVSFVSEDVELPPYYRGRHANLFAAYVTFFPDVEGSLTRRRDWLRDVYIGERYQGQVVSDFDEQVPRFGDAPFGLLRVLNNNIDIARLPEDLGTELSEALQRYSGLRIYGSVTVIGTSNQEIEVSDTYNVNQAGVVGSNAKGENFTLNQAVQQASADLDLPKLTHELELLRAHMRQQANTPEEDLALAEVGQAHVAAQAGDGSKALGHLKKAGQWALGLATAIGAGVAAGAIKSAMGL